MKKITLFLNTSLICLIGFSLNAQTVFINEIHYDNEGTDANEAIEIAGSAGTDLSGWSLVLYNGNNSESYDTKSLSVTLNDDVNRFGFEVFNYPSNGIQNGSADGVALVDDQGKVVQFLSYEGTITAINGPANGLTSTDIGVSERGSTPIGQSLQLVGTGTSYDDFTWANVATNTYDAVNNNQSFEITGGGSVFIHDVQGAGSSSPLVGQTVTIEGIVVGDFQTTVDGFYVQEEDTDADAQTITSEGVFIYAPGAVNVNIGDLVSVTGTVTEFSDLTEINNTTNVQVVSSGNSLPSITSITLPHSSTTYLEQFEGMYVEYNQTLVVTNSYLLGRGGELTLSFGNRLYQPTQVVDPGASASAKLAENKLNSIIIDDASMQQNPDPIIFPSPEMDFNNHIRGGYNVTNVKGVMTYAWSGFNLGGQSTSAYRVYVTDGPVFDSLPNPRKSQPDAVGGTLKVASFNVLNYFNGDGQGGGFPTPRGADNISEFNRQRDKIINAILAMDADIIGLMEIENDGYGSLSAIQDLVNSLNNPGSNTYDFVSPGLSQIGTDQITVGFLYKTGTVTLEGSAAILDSSVDPLFNTDKNRPALAQSFKEIASGEIITVCVNHLKSKGSNCDALGDPDTGDGQANCNITRKNAATALVNWMATDPTSSCSSYKMIIGDLNAYAKEDPIETIENGGYTNLLKEQEGLTGYSYSFSGQWGTLDYAFSDSTLAPFITGATSWHVNADEAAVLDYNEEFKSAGQITSFYNTDAHRASDHDPIIVGIEFPQMAFKFQTGTISNIGSTWEAATLDKTYNSMVTVSKTSNLSLNIDEDQITDLERKHLGGHVAYVVIGDGVSSFANNISKSSQAKNDQSKRKLENSEVMVNVFPNPAQKQITVQSNAIYGKGSIHIYQLDGTVVAQLRFNSKNGLFQKVNLQKLPNGIYILKVSHNHGLNVSKVLLNR